MTLTSPCLRASTSSSSLDNYAARRTSAIKDLLLKLPLPPACAPTGSHWLALVERWHTEGAAAAVSGNSRQGSSLGVICRRDQPVTYAAQSR